MSEHAWASLHGPVPTELHEDARLEALDQLDILDSPGEEAFDRITRIARQLFAVPIAYISLLDAHRQWYKSCVGVPPGEAPRSDAMCDVTLREAAPVIATDASIDPRFIDNPYVTGDAHIRFYAGVPLKTREGYTIGTLCLCDVAPREFTAAQLETLVDLSRIVMDEVELRMIATIDSLTGAMSRRAFKEAARREVALALRHGQPLSVIGFDLDHFKRINDSHGHPFGDLVLDRAAKICRAELRTTDLMGRLGGEEFAVLLPQTARPGAMLVAEKLRQAIAGLDLRQGGQRAEITASFGVSSLDPVTRDLDTLLANADAALYRAKAAGRNTAIAFRTAEDERRELKRRVLKAGKIVLNSQFSTLDCTVRSLSETGAGIDVFTTIGVPKNFELLIRADDFRRQCLVVERAPKHLEVEFV